ncbi:DNA repair protein RadA-like [Hibiscus syriacus]|uniref:DNA repair protein RadA-like n=1 Tax=Hibiscus syriacus TaxID=106335 RepID=UPI0019214FA2|nr:DNA repair protein RadA-like [Hibiscus syriacus]
METKPRNPKNVCYIPKDTEGMSRKKAFLDNGSGLGDILGNKKKGKVKYKWVCEICGYTNGQWWGVCHSCDLSGTMKHFMEEETKNRGLDFSETLVRSWLRKDAGDLLPVRLIEVSRGVKKRDYRISLFGPFGSEVARVLGGGLVPDLHIQGFLENR